MTTHLFPQYAPSISKRETGSGGLKTRQRQQGRLNIKHNTALLPYSPWSYFIVCLSLLSRQLWLVNICRGSNLYLRKQDRFINAFWTFSKLYFKQSPYNEWPLISLILLICAVDLSYLKTHQPNTQSLYMLRNPKCFAKIFLRNYCPKCSITLYSSLKSVKCKCARSPMESWWFGTFLYLD